MGRTQTYRALGGSPSRADYDGLISLEGVFREDVSRFIVGAEGAARARDRHSEVRPDLHALAIQLDFSGHYST